MKKITNCEDVLNMLKDLSSRGIVPTDEILTVDFDFLIFRGLDGRLQKILPPKYGDILFVERLFGDIGDSENIIYWPGIIRCIHLSINKFIDNLFEDEDLKSIGKFDKSKTLISCFVEFNRELGKGSCLLGERDDTPKYVGNKVNSIVDLLNRYLDVRDYCRRKWTKEYLPVEILRPFDKLSGISMSIDSLIHNWHGRLKMLNMEGPLMKNIMTPILNSHIDKDYLLHKVIMCKDCDDLIEEYESMYEALYFIGKYIDLGFNLGKKGIYNIKCKKTSHILLGLLSGLIWDTYLEKNGKNSGMKYLPKD
jgi:hypothetical protein